MRPCPENPAIAALEGLLAKNRGTSEAPVHLFLLASLLAGAGSPKRSGAQPQGGRVRGASARRALETGQGGRHVPRELVLARFGGRRLLGAQGAERLSSPLGDWICAKRFLLTGQLFLGPEGRTFCFFLPRVRTQVRLVIHSLCLVKDRLEKVKGLRRQKTSMLTTT